MMNKISSKDPGPGAAVSVAGLNVRRGRREVLRDVDLTVTAGMVTGLLGPSGCGKTTLLRSIVGTQRITSGEVTVLDTPAGHRDLRRKIGYVTQAPSVYDDLTVTQNLRYFSSVVDADRAEVDRVIGAVRLDDQRDSRVRDLSGGQVSRVSLAVGMLGKPPLLILDEPTVGLDPLLRRELWGLFRSLADGGTTLIVSSHVTDEAARCDSLILMQDGRVLDSVTPEELLDRTGAGDMDAAFVKVVEGES